MTKFIAIIVLMALSVQIIASDTLGFVSPVDHKVILSGNFMELRSNHFHSGIDIKSTKGVPGDIIRSVHDGYVSRIRITSGSYGNALYIDHPNGYTSVYAHLDEFIPELESYLEGVQYELESFEVDIYLPDSLLAVVRGQEIGRMGNSGRSSGPHLHFEIRETATEKPVNPELYGFGPQDSKAPVLQALYIYEINGDKVGHSEVTYFKNNKSGYKLHLDQLSVDSDKVGLGLQMYDSMNGASNKNGIYSYELFVNDSLHYLWKADAFSFDDNRKINAFMDYGRYKAFSQKIYLLFRQKCSDFDSSVFSGNGTIELDDNSVKSIKINVIDLGGNTSTARFKLTKGNTALDTLSPTIECSHSYSKQSGMFNIHFDEGSFFSPQYLQIEDSKASVLGQDCYSIKIGKNNIPINKNYFIESKIPEEYNSQWAFISKDRRGRYHSFGGDTLNGMFFTQLDELGTYYLYRDTDGPILEVVNLNASLKTPWKIKMRDNLIPDGTLNELYYRASVNGKWIRMQYDLKNNLLVFDDFDRIGKRPYELEVIAVDNGGNISKLSRIVQ